MAPLLKTLVFTIIVPGTVAVYVPYLILQDEARASFGVFRLTGIVPLTVGVGFYLWCAWHFASRGRGTPAPIDPPKMLVSHGLYAVVRNPMYVGVLGILFGEAILFSSMTLVYYSVFVTLGFHAFIVLYEEPGLKIAFGASYEEYCETVPRWLPRLKRRHELPP